MHHSDRGVRAVSIRYTERLADAGIEPSVGSVGNIPPAAAKACYYAQIAGQAMAA